MNNREIYQKTIGFSVRRLLWDIAAFLTLTVLGGTGYFVAEKMADKGLIGMGAGLLIGIIGLVVFLRYISYTYKAGQIAMMTKGITEGSLPEDVIGEGKKAVKERFATVAIFFAATGVIKGIFNQIGRGITAIGDKLGGDSGRTVGSVINTVIQVIIAYLSDCCLGWIFFRKEVKAAKATCEGAVLFFRHGKTLGKNMGRVFGMGLASLVLIGGAFTGIFFLVVSGFPGIFNELATEIGEIIKTNPKIPEVLAQPVILMWIAAGIAGLILWSIIHSAFIRPFVLVGVLRNYIASGVDDIPDGISFAVLDSKSDRFRKLHAGLA